MSALCADCARLLEALTEAQAAAYQQGHEQGAAHVAVEIVLWLEGLAATTSRPSYGALYKQIAKGIMDAEYMPEEADKAL